MLKVCWVAPFYKRYKCITRIIRQYLLQVYSGKSVLLLFNNSSKEYVLDDIPLPPNKQIILVNNGKCLKTGEEYEVTGEIFEDALTFIPDDVDVVSWADSDDFFLPEHLSEGIKGYQEAVKQEMLAYKPYYSWFKYVGQEVKQEHNFMEPSVFVNKEYIVKTGMAPLCSGFHLKWLFPLIKQEKILQLKDGIKTFLYWWGGDDGVYKISSKGDKKSSFQECRKWEKDEGSDVLRPCSVEEIQYYYNVINYTISASTTI